MEGSEWAYDKLKLQMTDNLTANLKAVILRWDTKQHHNEETVRSFYIPVYLTTLRKNLLFSVLIHNESKLSDADWYQRGICLVSCNKEYEYTLPEA